MGVPIKQMGVSGRFIQFMKGPLPCRTTHAEWKLVCNKSSEAEFSGEY